MFTDAHCCINEDQKDNFVCNEYRDAILFLISNLTRGICKNKLPFILNNIFTKKIHLSNVLHTCFTKEKPKNMPISYEKLYLKISHFFFLKTLSSNKYAV